MPVGGLPYTFSMMNRQDGGWGLPELEGAERPHSTEEVAVDTEELRASALRQARRLVEFYRITPQELLDSGDLPGSPATQESVQPNLPVKYRHPVTGETWDGVGLHPQWMRQALLHDGYRVEELRVNPVLEEPHARSVA